MSALFRLSGRERSEAVATAFAHVYATRDGRASVSFLDGHRTDSIRAVEVFLLGLGWNPSYSGTQEALIVRKPNAQFHLWFIPYTRLVSIEVVGKS
jgi:hypothetical protein